MYLPLYVIHVPHVPRRVYYTPAHIGTCGYINHYKGLGGPVVRRFTIDHRTVTHIILRLNPIKQYVRGFVSTLKYMHVVHIFCLVHSFDTIRRHF